MHALFAIPCWDSNLDRPLRMALNRHSRSLGCDDRLSNSKFVSTDSISQADTEVASDHPIGQNQQQQQPQIQQH